jgi:hypothetical protein
MGVNLKWWRGVNLGGIYSMVADDPTNKIALKTFHCEIQNDHDELKKEEESYQPIPIIRTVDQAMIQRNYSQIKQDVQDIIASEMERLREDPSLARLIIRK